MHFYGFSHLEIFLLTAACRLWEQTHSRFCFFHATEASRQFWSTSCHCRVCTNVSGSLLFKTAESSSFLLLLMAAFLVNLLWFYTVKNFGCWKIGTRFDQAKCKCQMISPSYLVCFRLCLPLKGDVLFPLVAVHYPLLPHDDAPCWLHLAVLGRVGKGTAGD